MSRIPRWTIAVLAALTTISASAVGATTSVITGPGAPASGPVAVSVTEGDGDGAGPAVQVELDLARSPHPGPRPVTPPQMFAPVDQAGPELQVPRAALDASLRCPANLAAAGREVVLMIPGTTVDPDEAFAWNYAPALTAEQIPYCTVTLPNHTNGDIQVAAEYVVDAVRTIHAATGHRVILFGWSQGASTLPRWALRFWPDIRPLVASLVGLAPLNNTGSVVGNGPCLGGSCVPAAWQQSVGSRFMTALNSGQQTFPGIAYTVIYSRFDEVVTPDVDGALSVLPEGPNVLNVAIQDVCAADVSEHLLIPASPTAYAIALDAFRHPGEPADLARVSVPQPCLPGTMPHVNPIDLLTQEARIAANVGPRLLTGQVDREPDTACYVTASCA